MASIETNQDHGPSIHAASTVCATEIEIRATSLRRMNHSLFSPNILLWVYQKQNLGAGYFFNTHEIGTVTINP